MGFFGDIKIITSVLTNKFCDKTKEKIRDVFNSIDYVLSPLNELDENYKFIYNRYKSLYVVDKEWFLDESSFTKFAYTKNGKLYIGNEIFVKPDSFVYPNIPLDDKGNMVLIERFKDYIFVKRLYDDEGNNLKDDRIRKDFKDLKHVSYHITKSHDVNIDFTFKSSRDLIFTIGTILRRHKTSGTAYNRKIKENKLETIANLSGFKSSSIDVIMYNDDGEIIQKYNYIHSFPKLAYDIINDKLLLILLFDKNPSIQVIDSIEYVLDEKDKSTKKIILYGEENIEFILNPLSKCFLHNKNF